MPNDKQEYPEHEKLVALGGKNHVIANFLDWCQSKGMELCLWPDDADHPRAVREPTAAILARYFDIDEKKIEAEKQAMIADLQNRGNT